MEGGEAYWLMLVYVREGRHDEVDKVFIFSRVGDKKCSDEILLAVHKDEWFRYWKIRVIRDIVLDGTGVDIDTVFEKEVLKVCLPRILFYFVRWLILVPTRLFTDSKRVFRKPGIDELKAMFMEEFTGEIGKYATIVFHYKWYRVPCIEEKKDV